jgi:hypothetical protein
LSPTLIGFGLNIGLGLIGLIITVLAIVFWKESWNKTFGLADALLYLTLFMCLSNQNTILLVLPVLTGVVAELFFLKKMDDEVPLIWIYSKWIAIMLILTVFYLLIGGLFG